MIIQTQGLSKSYDGHKVFQNISFLAKTGVTQITGTSGSGKTTLLRILLGLEAPDCGQISSEGLRWTAVFQENRLLESLNAAANLRFVLGSQYRQSDLDAWMRRLGLYESREKPVREYSGGMKRRLALIRALLTPSDAVALDEPFTGLDEENRKKAIECIQEAGKTRIIFLSSHEQLPDLSDEEIHLPQ